MTIGAISQILSTASNVLFTLFMVRLVEPRLAVSVLTLVLIGYVIPFSANRASAGIDMMNPTLSREARAIASASLVLGCVWIPVSIATGVFLSLDPFVYLAFASVVPLLLAQDAYRCRAIVSGMARVAIAADVCWTACVAVTGLALSFNHGMPTKLLLISWMVGGLIALALVSRGDGPPFSRSGLELFRSMRSPEIGRLIEPVATDGFIAVAFLMLARFGATDTALSWRSLQLIFGPIQILFFAMTIGAVNSRVGSERSNRIVVKAIFAVTLCIIAVGGLTYEGHFVTFLLGSNVTASVRRGVLSYSLFQLATCYAQPPLLRLRAHAKKGLLPVRVGWAIGNLAGVYFLRDNQAALYLWLATVTGLASLLWRHHALRSTSLKLQF
jgi:hypothetical protein